MGTQGVVKWEKENTLGSLATFVVFSVIRSQDFSVKAEENRCTGVLNVELCFARTV